MKLEIQEGALEDLKNMEKQIQRAIRDEIKNLKENPLGEKSSLLSKQGLEIFRLKIKKNNLDHRVFFDIKDGKVIVLGAKHRDDAYTPESLEKIKDRK